ncbi:MAG TPA: hypothetical protein VKK31_31495 [Thermoanaerobaculia bacterium]|nr:hypothetical protein [Thermoanaerobaculia bacterium]
MAIVGILANGLNIGAINTNASATLVHNFGPSSIWAHPSLQGVGVNSDEAGADATVSRFVDGTGTNNVSLTGVFATNCTSVTYRLAVRDCIARALCVTEFLG